MSFDLNVFIEKKRMLTPQQWQAQIEAAEFPLRLNQDFDPHDFSGFLPCHVGDQEVGFEFYFDVLEDTMFDPSTDLELAERLGLRDICVGFSVAYGLSEESAHSAVMAAATLARAADGVLWVDPEFIETDDPVQWAKQGQQE